MIKPADDIFSNQTNQDPTKYKQARKEQGIDWSDRLLTTGTSRARDPGNTRSIQSASEKHDIENAFFSMLLSDSESQVAPHSHGTPNPGIPLNKQEDDKKKLVVEEFQITSQDFGSAKVEVRVNSNSIFLSLVVEKPLNVQHIAILQKLVANRLGHQFGKNFEVQITCKN